MPSFSLFEVNLWKQFIFWFHILGYFTFGIMAYKEIIIKIVNLCQATIKTLRAIIIHNIAPSQFEDKFHYVSCGSWHEVGTVVIFTCQNLNPTGAKCWNIIPERIQNINEYKTFSKTYKQDLLFSILSDPNYKLENSFDYFINYWC